MHPHRIPAAPWLLLGLFLLPVLLRPVAAEAPDGPAYQKAFAKMARKLGETPRPPGPVWILPEARPGKEACTSCHLGIADDRFLYANPPYRRHSGHILKDHPPQRFGCTICHGGAGGGLGFAEAGHAARGDRARRKRWERLFGWRPPAPAKEGMVASAFIAGRCAACHRGPLPRGAERYAAARTLVANKRCGACHRFKGLPQKKVRRAVRLDALGSKVGAKWLERYLSDPAAFRPGTAMPAYTFKKGEAAILAAFLTSRRNPDIGWEAPPKGDPALGRKIVEARHCITCHDIPGIAESGFLKQAKVGPSLARVGEKLNPRWIRAWLQNPDAVRPGAGMPRFRFKKGEIDDVAAFLSSLKKAPPPAASRARSDPERAAALVEEYACKACHEISGLPAARPPKTDLTAIGPAILGRLEAGSKAPGFHTSAQAPHLLAGKEEFDLAATFLAAQVDLALPATFRLPAPPRPPTFDPPALVRELRCLSCHTIRGTGGDIGPDLSFAASKLRRAWIVAFLKHPQPIRPMNRARMPDLGLAPAEAEALADWIEAELRSEPIEKSRPDLDAGFSFMGDSKFTSSLSCIACHTVGDAGGKVGPELTHAASRLKTKWIYFWLQDPQRLVPGVRMPNFRLSTEDLASLTAFLEERK